MCGDLKAEDYAAQDDAAQILYERRTCPGSERFTDKGINSRIPPDTGSAGRSSIIERSAVPCAFSRVTGKVSLDRTFQAGKVLTAVSSVLATSGTPGDGLYRYGNVGDE